MGSPLAWTKAKQEVNLSKFAAKSYTDNLLERDKFQPFSRARERDKKGTGPPDLSSLGGVGTQLPLVNVTNFRVSLGTTLRSSLFIGSSGSSHCHIGPVIYFPKTETSIL